MRPAVMAGYEEGIEPNAAPWNNVGPVSVLYNWVNRFIVYLHFGVRYT